MALGCVIFDFNGTLYWDTPLHNSAWDILLERHRIAMSDEEKHRNLHGKNNREILRGIFGSDITDAQAQSIADEKEAIYRELCLGTKMELAPGALDLFDFLRDSRIPHTIATASTVDNVDFYFHQFRLDRWFARARVVYNDGTIASKPNPEIFIIAARRLGCEPKSVLIFEDSFAGIRAAERAGAAKVIIVNSNDEDYRDFTHEVIRDFAEVDRAIFSPA